MYSGILESRSATEKAQNAKRGDEWGGWGRGGVGWMVGWLVVTSPTLTGRTKGEKAAIDLVVGGEDRRGEPEGGGGRKIAGWQER